MPKKIKAVALLSAGLDSTTALTLAIQEYQLLLALTFDYGQKAAKREISSAKKIAKHYKIPHLVLRLPWFKKIIKTSLVNKKSPVPFLTKVQESGPKTAAAVWVPNRNGLFLNIAAAYAESLGANIIITGFNQEEAKTFPDNSQDFCKSANNFFSFSTQNKVKVKNYFFKQSKPEILKIAINQRAPLEFIWPCYQGFSKFCGNCESCIRLKNALEKTNLSKLSKKYKNYWNLK